MGSEAIVVDDVRSLDKKIDDAASEGDFTTLESLLADDFIYTHTTGNAQTKGDWLESLKSLAGQRRRVPSAISVELHDDVAVVMGDLDIVWSDGRSRHNRYVRVYRHQAGRWRAISQRTVPAADRLE